MVFYLISKAWKMLSLFPGTFSVLFIPDIILGAVKTSLACEVSLTAAYFRVIFSQFPLLFCSQPSYNPVSNLVHKSVAQSSVPELIALGILFGNYYFYLRCNFLVLIVIKNSGKLTVTQKYKISIITF